MKAEDYAWLRTAQAYAETKNWDVDFTDEDKWINIKNHSGLKPEQAVDLYMIDSSQR
jgi:hypothetical protein